MNEPVPSQQPTQTTPQIQPQTNIPYTNDEISIADIITKLWARRGLLFIVCLITAAITAGGLLVARSILPSTQYLEQPFEITFDGALDGHFPNGQNFNYADIADISILKTALGKSELKDSLSLEDLGKAIVIIETNDDLEQARQVFTARLQNKKLTVAERTQIELEYHERMDALRKPLFKIRWHGEKAAQLPRSAIEKILADILAAWAQDAIERKGAFKLTGGMLGASVLESPAFQTTDLLMRIDSYHHVLKKAAEQLKCLRELPGADQVRLSNGISLEELALQLQHLVEFRLPVLTEIARWLNGGNANGLSDRLYTEARLDSLHLQEKLLSDQEKVLQDSWKMQGNLSTTDSTTSNNNQQPNFSMGSSMDGALLDRMVELVESAGRTEYRQKLLDKMIEHGYKIAELRKEVAFYERYNKQETGHAKDQKEGNTEFAKQIQAVDQSVSSILQDMQNIHNEVSAVQLRRGGSLYSTTGPMTYVSDSILSCKKMILVFVGILALIGGLTAAAILLLPKRNHPGAPIS